MVRTGLRYNQRNKKNSRCLAIFETQQIPRDSNLKYGYCLNDNNFPKGDNRIKQ